jgi:hypothetical protein
MLGTLAVAMALLGSLGTTTASAATGSRATSAVPASSFVHYGSASTLGAKSVVSPFSSCTITRYGYTGQYICGTGGFDVTPGEVANNGGAESFVIGTNWQIWHAWPGSNGWKSLGGVALHDTTNEVVLSTAFPFFSIATIGTDGGSWCDNWGTPKWSGWYSCT